MKNSVRRAAALCVAAIFPLALAGCGSTDAPQSSTSTGASAVSVTDSAGKTITLPKPASRVVALEWGVVEDVVDLGVQPVGVADPKGFAKWDTSVQLTSNPLDVGMRTEPSLESIAKAEPEVIIGVEGSLPADAIAQAEKIAPVVLLKPADAARPLELMRSNYTTVATLLGKSDVATTKLKAMDEAFTQAKTTLAAKASTPIAISYISTRGNKVDFRMHGEASLPGAVAKEIGLTNAWKGTSDSAWGIGSMDLEALGTLPANTVLLSVGDDGQKAIDGPLASNPLWTSLPMVQQHHVHATDKGIWLYGGPASMTRWAHALTTALA